jgi:hypothetical protein
MNSTINLADVITKEQPGSMLEVSRLTRQVNNDALMLILLDDSLKDLILTTDEAIQAL